MEAGIFAETLDVDTATPNPPGVDRALWMEM